MRLNPTAKRIIGRIIFGWLCVSVVLSIGAVSLLVGFTLKTMMHHGQYYDNLQIALVYAQAAAAVIVECWLLSYGVKFILPELKKFLVW